MMTQQQAQEFSYQIGSTWYENVILDYSDVNLGDAIAYEVMRVLGVIFMRHIEKGKGDGRSESGTT